jgi:hypothetical protein
MKIILRAQLVTDWGEVTEVDVAEFSRPARALSADSLGLSLTDGKALLQQLTKMVARTQADELCELHRVCQRCHRWNPIKDYRLRKIERATKSLLAADFGKLRWCLWHNNASKLDKKLHQILLMCRIVVPETAGFKESLERIDYRVHDVLSYVLSNSVKPVAYGRRYRKGQSISSAMAESAVNQVVNARMCKRQQMRWTPRGAHLLTQVRCAMLNGDAAEKLRAYEAATEYQVEPEIQQFLERLQRAA